MELPDCFDRAALQKLGRNFLLEGLDDRLHQCGWDRCDDRRACACLGAPPPSGSPPAGMPPPLAEPDGTLIVLEPELLLEATVTPFDHFG